MTGQNWNSKARKTLAILLVMAILFSLGGGLTPLAQEPEPLAPDAPDAPHKVGVEWVADFEQCPANDLPNCTQPECMKLYNALVGEGWTGSFHWGNNAAWETDFKRAAAGGSENSWIDSVDLGLFCSHGSGAYDAFWGQNLSSLYFGYPHDDCHLTPGEAYVSYGDYNLEWLAFFACSVLSDGGPAPYYNRGYWASTMDGLHLMLGMKTTMYCSSTIGQKWAHYMQGLKWPFWPYFWLRPPYKITQSWFEATDDTQPGGVCARVLAEVSDNYNDYLWGKGYVSPDPTHNGIYWYWDHCSCTPPPQQVEDVDQILAVPILQVMPRDVNEDLVLQVIAPAFGMADTMVYSDTEYFYLMGATEVETQTLQVDKASGGWKFRVQNELWVPPMTPPRLPSLDQALADIEEFFALQGEALPGAWYRTGEILDMVEEMVEVQMDNRADGTPIEQELQRIPVDLAVSYGRVEQLPVETSQGTQMQVFSIVGPGARTKVYLGDQGKILGMQGGSRDIQTTGDTVPLLDPETAWNLFLEDPTIALASIPWAYDEVMWTPGVGPTLGYYEEPQAQGQQELVPTWIFYADFYAAGEPLAQGVPVYVPAAGEYLPPVVQIDSPADGAEFSPGEMIAFSGSVVQGGQAPFAYEWHSSHDGLLGTEAMINTSLTAAVGKSTVISHTISLEVIDANGQEGADSIQVFIRPAVYLPLILKNR
jgi:hypothetical protein